MHYTHRPDPDHTYRNHPAYPRSLDEVCREAAAEFDDFRRHPRWGGWTLDPTWLVLRNDDCPYYEIDLRECVSPEDVLDWIAHVRDRYSPEQMGHLVAALDDLLGFRKHLLAFCRQGGMDIPDVRAHLEREGWLVNARRPEDANGDHGERERQPDPNRSC